MSLSYLGNMTYMENLILLPNPRNITAQPGALALTTGARIVCQGDPAVLLPLAERLQDAVLETQWMEWHLWAGDAENDPQCQAVISLTSHEQIPAQGYRLHITPARIHLVAGDAAGAFYGVMTLRQMLRQCEGALPACEIEDHPDFPSRGVMLDISRDKVPTLETLFALVDQLAEWKVNHLELYTEHTFAYRNHPGVWAQASPMTGEDVLRLDAYCRERFVELVPNQNSFGHLHHWLQLPRYRHLAECPDGCEWPWDKRRHSPFSLDPTNPQSLALLEELYADLLPHFTSRKFSVGCDEPFDLGLGKSKAECERKGKGRVYLEFLLKLYELVKRHGRTMHFWGDVIIQHPELVPELPRDVVVLAWGYEADHLFDEYGAKFAQLGIPFYVCPGTSSWNSIAGRTENGLANLRNATASGLKYGAVGFLNTDWGDNGHWQYLPVSYLGLAAGAALSWCYESNVAQVGNLRYALDLHAFHDLEHVMGKLAYDLGNAYLQVGHTLSNATVLFNLLHQPLSQALPDSVTEESLQATRESIQSVIEPLEQSHMDRVDAALIQAEFANAARMLLHACNRGIAMRQGNLDSPQTREALAAELRTILEEHRRLWVARNRESGLQDSVGVLEHRLREYTGEE